MSPIINNLGLFECSTVNSTLFKLILSTFSVNPIRHFDLKFVNKHSSNIIVSLNLPFIFPIKLIHFFPLYILILQSSENS